MKRKNQTGDARAELLEAAERVGPAAGAVSPDSPVYHLSTATSDPLRRRLRGLWTVVEHRVGDLDYVERFAARALKGAALEDVEYRAQYEFKDRLCLKRVEITGSAPEAGPDSGSGSGEYRYRLSLALSWDFQSSCCLAIRPELGYQCTELGGEAVAVKELDAPSETTLVAFRFEGDVLVLEEGDDHKRLERVK